MSGVAVQDNYTFAQQLCVISKSINFFQPTFHYFPISYPVLFMVLILKLEKTDEAQTKNKNSYKSNLRGKTSSVSCNEFHLHS